MSSSISSASLPALFGGGQGTTGTSAQISARSSASSSRSASKSPAPYGSVGGDTDATSIHSDRTSSEDDLSGTRRHEVTDLLRKAAQDFPQQGVLFVEQHDVAPTFMQYPELYAEAKTLAASLQAALAPEHPGSNINVVLAFGGRHRDILISFWAVCLAGMIPCILGQLNGDENEKAGLLRHLDRLFEGPIFLARASNGRTQFLSQLAPEIKVLDLESLGGQRSSEPAAGIKLGRPTASFGGAISQSSRSCSPAGHSETAVHLLTSGSTGFSKAAALTHANIKAAVSYKTYEYGLVAGDKMFSWLGADHAAGLVEAHITPMVAGLDQIHCAAEVVVSQPLRLLHYVEQHRVTHTFAPNFLLSAIDKQLRKTPDAAFDLSTLRRFNSGGEAVPLMTAKHLHESLVRASRGTYSAKLCPGFGMTETCAGCSYSPDSLVGNMDQEFVPISRVNPRNGKAPSIPQARLRIVDADGELLKEGSEQVGHLEVTGPMVFSGYFNNEEVTRDSFTRDGWFRTGDLAACYDEGEHGRAIYLTGRSKDSIIINGSTYHSHQLESSLETVPGCSPSFIAVTAFRPPNSQTERVAVFYLATFDPTDAHLRAKTQAQIVSKVVMCCSQAPHVVLPLPIDMMGKNSLGKLSRGKLRKALEGGAMNAMLRENEQLLAADRQRAIVLPNSPTEERLREIVAAVFDREADTVGVTDSFFEMGASSLEVISYRSEICKSFNLPDSWAVTHIMQHPSIRTLAAHLDSISQGSSGTAENADEAYNPIVPLQTSGSGTPLFFVHPGVGEVLIFVNLAKYMIDERPFYAFRTRGFDEGETPFSSMDEMASTYVTAMRKIQPEGPYAVAGYSYGGIVAFEIAKRLEAAGQEVAFVGLVNIPPHIQERMQEITWTMGILNLAYFLSLITKERAHGLQTDLARIGTPRQQIEALWTESSQDRIAQLKLTPGLLEKWVGIAQALITCGKDYQPSGSVRSATVFYAVPLAGEKQAWLDRQLRPWQGFVREPMRFVDVPGAHYTLMDGDHAVEFQRHLRGELHRAGL